MTISPTTVARLPMLLAAVLTLLGAGCKPAAECATSAHCEEGEVCDVAQCRAVCDEGADCAGGQSCEYGCATSERVCIDGDRCPNCEDDSNCPLGFICLHGNCVQDCVTHEDCAQGLVCSQDCEAPVRICQTEDACYNHQPADSQGCVSSDGAQIQRELYYTVMIASATDSELCDSTDDGAPGPDIFGVALEDEHENVIGWGNWIGDDIQIEGNEHTDVTLINGKPLAIPGSQTCTDSFDDSAVSLGCPGPDVEAFMVFDFLDANGMLTPVDPCEENSVLRVYEWGGQCTDGAVAEKYDLFICTDTNAVKNDFTYTSCTIPVIEGGSGESAAEVGDP